MTRTAEVSPLEHRTIIAVDVVEFATPERTMRDPHAVQEGLYALLRTAFTSAGINFDDCDVEDRGDGVLILMSPSISKSMLVDMLPDRLAAEIRRHNATRANLARIKLRVAVHAGEIRRSVHGWSGAAVVLAFRILEAQEASMALQRSESLLALIVSEYFYSEVVVHDPGADPESYRRITVSIKTFTGFAWLRLVGVGAFGRSARPISSLISVAEMDDVRRSADVSVELISTFALALEERHLQVLVSPPGTDVVPFALLGLSRLTPEAYRVNLRDTVGLADLSAAHFRPERGYLLEVGVNWDATTELHLRRLSELLAAAGAYAVIMLDDPQNQAQSLAPYFAHAVSVPVPPTDPGHEDHQALSPDGGLPTDLPIESDVEISTDVDWSTDTPAEADFLKRDALAQVLVDRICETRRRYPSNSLLVHLDGAWGAGKSSLLNLIGKRLDGDFLVVRFDAWQQSRLSPPWWALLTTARHAIVNDKSWWKRHWLRLKETFERARRSGAPYLLALILLLVGAAGLGAVVKFLLSSTPKIELLKVAGPVTTSVLAVWAGTQVASRMLLWNSARGARLFEQSDSNPLTRVTEHFSWLLGQSAKPVVFFIDDLDRCKNDYVVELLESVQTMVRDTEQAHAYFIVAADGVWLRKSFACSYGTFADGDKPHNSIGYQFLDKLFQLSVPMPALSTSVQHGFLGRLLGLQEPVATEAVAAARAKLDNARGSETQILEALADIEDLAVREAVAADAALAMEAVETRQATEHQLTKFASLLAPNPRSTKLFLNTYSMLRAVRTLEAIAVNADTLALWSLVRVCYPGIADHLQRNPEAVQGIRDPLWCSECFPEELREAAGSKGLRSIVTHSAGGPLTPELIRQCCGTS